MVQISKARKQYPITQTQAMKIKKNLPIFSNKIWNEKKKQPQERVEGGDDELMVLWSKMGAGMSVQDGEREKDGR